MKEQHKEERSILVHDVKGFSPLVHDSIPMMRQNIMEAGNVKEVVYLMIKRKQRKFSYNPQWYILTSQLLTSSI